MQKGKGVGCFLKGVYRSVLPLVKKGSRAIGKAVGKEALRVGVNILDDITHGKPFKESFRNNIRESRKNLKRKAEEKLDNLISGSGYKTNKEMIRVAGPGFGSNCRRYFFMTNYETRVLGFL